MAIKTYSIKFFNSFLNSLTSKSKCLQKRRFCEFIPLDSNETFSFYHFQIPQGIPFSKNMVSGLGIFFRILAVLGNRAHINSPFHYFRLLSLKFLDFWKQEAKKQIAGTRLMTPANGSLTTLTSSYSSMITQNWTSVRKRKPFWIS